MLGDILPVEVRQALMACENSDKLFEIRIRKNARITVNYAGVFYFLASFGISKNAQDGIFASSEMLDGIVYRATNYSIYAVNNQLKEGFITLETGERIGICGEIVAEQNNVTTIKNITSLNIRIPHTVVGCSEKTVRFLVSNSGEIKNTLIISPPGAGKTTFLRDIVFQLKKRFPCLNVLVVDERGEIATAQNQFLNSQSSSGVDVVYGANKGFAFTQGIRTMRPDVIVADELVGEKDVMWCYDAITCGVKIFASLHANGKEDLLNKVGYDKLLSCKLFDRFVVLSTRNGVGTIDGVFDSNFKSVYITM